MIPNFLVIDPQRKSTILNIIQFLVTANFGSTTGKYSIWLTISLIFGVIFILLITMIAEYQDMAFIQTFFNILWFYCVPMFLPLFINVFLWQYSTVTTKGFTNLVAVSIVFHFLLVVICGLFSVYCSIFPALNFGPFFAFSFHKAIVVSSFYMILLHFHSPISIVSSTFHYIRTVVSLIMVFYVLIKKPYGYRLLNMLISVVALYSTLVSGLFSFVYNPEDEIGSKKCGKIGILLLIPSIIFPFFYYYILYPFYVRIKKSTGIIDLCILGQYEKVKRIFETMNPIQIPKKERVLYLKILLFIHPENLIDILEYYANTGIESIEEYDLIWALINVYLDSQKETPLAYAEFLHEQQDKLQKLEQDFRTRTWMSDISSLPQIAGQLGRVKISSIYSIIFGFQKYPHLKDSDIIKPELKEEINHYQRTKRFKIYTTEIFVAISFFLLMLGLTLNEQDSKIHFSSVRDCYDVMNFSIFFYNYQMAIWNNNEKLRDFFFNKLCLTFERVHSANDIRPLAVSPPRTNPSVPSFIDSFYEFRTDFKNGEYTKTLNTTLFYTIDYMVNFSYPYIMADALNFHKRANFIGKIIMIFSPLLMILYIIIFLIKFSISVPKFYSRFRTIPKDKIKNIDTHILSMDAFPINNSFSITKTIKFQIVSFIIGLSLILFCEIDLYVSLKSTDDEVRLGVLCQITDVDLIRSAGYLTHALSFSYLNKTLTSNEMRNQIIYQMKEYAELSEETFSRILHLDINGNIITAIPDNIYSIIGQILIGESEINYSTARLSCFSVFTAAKDITTEYQHEYINYFQRYFVLLIVAFVSTLEGIFLLHQFSKIGEAEMNQGKILLDEFLKDDSNSPSVNLSSVSSEVLEDQKTVEVSKLQQRKSSNSVKTKEDTNFSENNLAEFDYEIDIESFDLFFFLIDSSGCILRSSKPAKQKGLITGQNIRQSFLSNKIIFDIQTIVDSFCSNPEDQSPKVISLESNDSSLVLKPAFIYNGNQITLDRIMIIESNISQDRINDLTQKCEALNNLFIPDVVPRGHNLNLPIPSRSFNVFIILIKLNNFDKWVMSVEPEIATKCRQELSMAFTKHCKDSTSFCRISETATNFIASLRKDSQIDYWFPLASGAKFCQSILNSILDIAKKYMGREIISNFSGPIDESFNHGLFSASAIIFKCKEPLAFFPDRKVARFEYQIPIIRFAEQYLDHGFPWGIFYASEKKEIGNSNQGITPFRQWKSKDEEQCTLFLVVSKCN